MKKEKKIMKNQIKTGIFTTVTALTLLFTASCGSTKTAGTDEKKVFKIGVTQFADHPSLDNCREGFISGLKKNGFTDGENIEIEYKSAQSDMAMAKQIAEKFAADKKDLVCGIATPSAQSLYASCQNAKIPVIFNAISDPVGAKLAVSETENMDGVTGVSDRLPVKEQLELIRKILPDAKKIGILYTVSEANSVSTVKTYQELAGEYGFEIVDRGISKQAEVTQAADVLLNEVDCLSNLTDNTVVAALGVVLEKANAKNIPVFGSEEEQVKNGCIACCGLDYFKLGEQTGEIAARVLNGEDINTIHFETVKESSVFTNAEVAQKLGITLPADL